jgi:hypothetical protein
MLSLLNFGILSSTRSFKSVEWRLGWFTVGVGLSLLVLIGVVLIWRSHVGRGAIFVLAPSLLFPIWFVLQLTVHSPGFPLGDIIYQALADSGWLQLSLIGGIIIVVKELRGGRM